MSSGGGGQEGEVDLNIAPIVDCFTVLIAYLLVSISFLSLQILNVEISASGSAAIAPPQEPTKPPETPLTLSFEIGAVNRVLVKLTGGPTNITENYTIEPIPDGELNLDGLKDKVNQLKTLHPTLTEANVNAEPAVNYKQLVRVVEALKTTLSKIFIAS